MENLKQFKKLFINTKFNIFLETSLQMIYPLNSLNILHNFSEKNTMKKKRVKINIIVSLICSRSNVRSKEPVNIARYKLLQWTAIPLVQFRVYRFIKYIFSQSLPFVYQISETT